MTSLEQNGTRKLITLSLRKKVIGYKWVYIVKLNPNGSLTHLKARLVAKSYSQVYELDYVNTFSPITKMAVIRIMISLTATYYWPLHQLDIKNVFLNDILNEEVYMEQHQVLLLKGVCIESLHVEEVTLWSKRVSESLIWVFASVIQEFDLCRSREKSLCVLTNTA